MAGVLIALAAVLAVAAVFAALLVSGWLRGFAGQGAHMIAGLLEAQEKRSPLSSRERAELRARLWIPW